MELKRHLSSPHDLLLLLATFFIALTIPLTVFLTQRQQDIYKAAQEVIEGPTPTPTISPSPSPVPMDVF